MASETMTVQSACKRADWQQVVLNGGPPCFHIDEYGFCFRAMRWAGHDHPSAHAYVSLADFHARATTAGSDDAKPITRDHIERAAEALHNLAETWRVPHHGTPMRWADLSDVNKQMRRDQVIAVMTTLSLDARATTAGTGAEQMGERCYPDDHGQYAHECGICRAPFTGGKGRVVCRVCEPTGEELRRLRLTYEPERMGALVTAALAASARGAAS